MFKSEENILITNLPSLSEEFILRGDCKKSLTKKKIEIYPCEPLEIYKVKKHIISLQEIENTILNQFEEHQNGLF